MEWSFSGSRKARTKVDRFIFSSWSSGISTEIEGKYLKLGKRKAEADVDRDTDEDGVDKEEFETRTLLNGYHTH